MDKLQPILKNHFWILLVPLFSMNLWGYFSANSALKAATTARQAELDSVKSGIPAGTTDPNSKYADELKKGNDVLVKGVDKELLDLWNRQKARMIWPASVAADIPKVYKSEIKSNKVRLNYKNDYPAEKRKLHAIVEPYVADKRGITWTRKVDFPIEFINPHVILGNLAMPSPQMWEAQEDLWLTQFILEAIREMNKNADSESSAVVRKVIAFRLLGGNGESTVMPSEGGGDGSSVDDEDGSGGTGSRRPANLSQGVTTFVQFDPSEEFGTGGDPSMMGSYGRGGMNPMLASADEESGDGEAAEPTGPLRYVKEDEAAPFVERGFYLSVIINQDNLVDFLVALSNSEWPVRVVRFHFGKNPYGGPDPFAARGVSSGYPGGGLGMDDDDGQKGNGGRGMQRARPMQAPASDGESGLGALSRNGGLGNMLSRPGGLGAGPGAGPAASTGYPPDALLQPDLVQLDLAGLITMYRQPKEEIPTEGETPAEGETPVEGSADAPADAVTVEQPSASEGGLPAETSALETVEPVVETSTAAEPVTAAPATDEAPADSPAQPETATVEGTPEPAAEEAPAAVPAAPADTPDASPPASEPSPSEVQEKP